MLGAGLARAIKDQKDANRYQLAEHIILHIRNYPADPSIPSKHNGLDNTLARLWQVMSKNKPAETLLLAMTGKHRAMPHETLCSPSGIYHIDLTLVRVWQDMGKTSMAEKLLLAMAGKQPDMTEEMLCKACGNHDIDLAQMRLWQIMGKNKRVEQLVLSMTDGNPGQAMLLSDRQSPDYLTPGDERLESWGQVLNLECYQKNT